MGYPERKKKILDALEGAGNIDVHQLSEVLDISPVTIRRDLQQLADEGLLIRTHGGAMKADNGPRFPAFTDKALAAREQKQQIGELAASFVQPGDTIFLDCGSTVFCMCPHLQKIPGIRVITNSLPVLSALMHIPGITINLTGGEADSERKALHGLQAIRHIENYHAAKAFIGVDGLSVKSGLTAFSEKEAGISTAMSKNADTVYLLCDSSKIGKDSYFKFAPLSLFHYLLTDKGISRSQQKALEGKGVRVIKA
ncbi:DeoR/GlpR family DNA-binding transcription regulator [uncultured Chitinophaga sp.]|jgi:Transcriptional regulators of sugar metabolism|uniref:DeoR/GlpR family DNA-binding transcription regulator n=1 Tax=uncultured Chitinophaga sp. TaxID=339340 RepID=UPI00261BA007|nr:DeoR/GlpR family DNA-binding transcription regulator [uncultured Chitinophaga sp.]